MSTFSESDFDAERYDRSRPSYPDRFYAALDKYHQGPRRCVVDVGCGPGTATFQMAALLSGFEQVVGTDISPTMIEKARSASGSDERVSFEVSSGNEFSFLGAAKANRQTLDMVTAVECVHWFDFASFQSSVAANLRRGGTFAIWGYADAAFIDYPELDAVLNDVSYGRDQLGPFWQQPGRNVLRGMLENWVFDSRYFADEQSAEVRVADLRAPQHLHAQQRPLILSKEMTVSDYANYVRTFSAYHTWKTKHGDSEEDIAERLVETICTVQPELTPDSKVQVAWNTFYKFARRV
ncbi:hypothetical protein HG536_0H02960 [Torulaspora globosa]|uniref:Methyltransferase domain-containing protein n=1 Tax=Torulaspora globosa TaxID=48254 RepID=A0A7G3ZN35_9SACH|nr:uncharacterized protein HG536_0H02960 [Torulaspora globosa]QLL34921.1 hypothetical protein HG536_0H02960 [Torulaspora globosa]